MTLLVKYLHDPPCLPSGKQHGAQRASSNERCPYVVSEMHPQAGAWCSVLTFRIRRSIPEQNGLWPHVAPLACRNACFKPMECLTTEHGQASVWRHQTKWLPLRLPQGVISGSWRRREKGENKKRRSQKTQTNMPRASRTVIGAALLFYLGKKEDKTDGF